MELERSRVVRAAAGRAARQAGWVHRAVVPTGGRETWVEFAASTAGGRCPMHPAEETAPAWQVVDGSRGRIVGVDASGVCPEDGLLDAGWLRSGAVPAYDPADVVALASTFERYAAEQCEEAAVQLHELLVEDVEVALDRLESGTPVEDVVTSRGDLPGVACEPGVGPSRWGVYAWGWDPRRYGAAMVVKPGGGRAR